MSKKIGFAGLAAALGILLLSLSAMLPTGKMAFFFLSALPVMLTVTVSGIRYAFLCYAATALIGWFFFPSYPTVLAYALFFGYYPLLKLLIERLRSLPMEWVIKAVLFLLCGAAAYFIYPGMLIYMYAAIPVALAAADLLLTWVIGYLQEHFLKNRF